MFSQFRVTLRDPRQYEYSHSRGVGDPLPTIGVFAAGPITRAVAGSLARYERMLTKGGITRKRTRKAVARMLIDDIPANYLSEFKGFESTLDDTLPLDGSTPAWDPKAIMKPAWKMNDTRSLPDLSAYIRVFALIARTMVGNSKAALD